MQEFLSKIPDIIQVGSLLLTVITLLATVIVRITPNKEDDKFLGKISKHVVSVMRWLPTIGINPQTQKLEETIMELREKTNV